jgi:hypothetical protein
MKKLISWFSYKFDYIGVFNSPFVRPKFECYFGEIALGVPYFLPRKWIRSKDKPGYRIAVPRKFGFDVAGLGWKTKWSDTDYRFEWGPIISFVFVKWQIAVSLEVPYPYVDSYWEAWLYYKYNTDKTKSQRERIEECKKNFSVTWITYESDGTKTKRDCYNEILKEEYK